MNKDALKKIAAAVTAGEFDVAEELIEEYAHEELKMDTYSGWQESVADAAEARMGDID